MGMAELVELVKGFGLPGIVFIIWYFSQKSHDRTLAAYREDITHKDEQYKEEIARKDLKHQANLAEIRRTYEQGMSEQRQMYENNAELVRRYVDLSSDLKEVIMLNTRTITNLCDEIRGNQFCPMVRLNKKAEGVQR